MTKRSHHSTDLSAEIVWLRTLSFECPSPHPVPSIDVQNSLISLAHTRTKVCLKRTTARPFPFHSLLCSTLKYQDFLNTACCCPTDHADVPNRHGCQTVPGETRSWSWGSQVAHQCSEIGNLAHSNLWDTFYGMQSSSFISALSLAAFPL